MNYYRITLFILAIVGLLISLYLWQAYTFGGPIKCSGLHGCDTVRASAQSHFFGISTPTYGVFFYVVMAALAWLVGVVKESWLRYALLLWTGTGLAVSAYLMYISKFVIGAWCIWCVGSAIVAALLFFITWFGQRALLSDTAAADTVKSI